MKVKFFIFFLILLTARVSCFAQLRTFPKRYIQKLLNDTTDISKPQFMMYPVVAYSPETSVELGLSSLYVRYAKGDTTNRLSEINSFVFYTLENQFGSFFEHAIYSDKNKWFFLGKLKFQSFPLSYYEIGASSPNKKLARVDAFQAQIKERVLRQVYKSIYAGIEFDFQHLGNVDFKNYDSSTSYTKPIGHEGSTNFGVGGGILFDNRHNVLNVRKGLFAELAFLKYSKSLGSQYDFASIFSDFRFFHPIRKRNVFALQAIGQFTLGTAPFNQLALMGGEMMMRGYYTGRYRDKNLMAFQAEYRILPFSFAKRFGASIFMGSGLVSNTLKNTQIKNLVFAGGAGIKFLIFPKKDIWTRLDFAFTNEGHGIYLFIGEAF
jgi:hypothetical protein